MRGKMAWNQHAAVLHVRSHEVAVAVYGDVKV